jgi:hypothetical protein
MYLEPIILRFLDIIADLAASEFSKYRYPSPVARPSFLNFGRKDEDREIENDVTNVAA